MKLKEEGPDLPVLFPAEGVAGLTGEWRTQRPVLEPEKCKFCNICWQYCPDEAISPANRKENKVIEFDYDYCKGCGICATECPFDAIHMEREVK